MAWQECKWCKGTGLETSENACPECGGRGYVVPNHWQTESEEFNARTIPRKESTKE